MGSSAVKQNGWSDAMNQKLIVEKCMNFNMDRVTSRYARKADISQSVAKEHEAEIKKYLCLCALNPKERYGMVKGLDDLWHEFILDTRLYSDFCKETAGRYIHHRPSDPEDREIQEFRENIEAGYEKFLADYRDLFLQEPPKEIWIRIGDGAELGCDDDPVNCVDCYPV